MAELESAWHNRRVMTAVPDLTAPFRGWAHEIAMLRTRVERSQKGPTNQAVDAATQVLETCDGLLEDLRAQHLACERLAAELQRSRAMCERLFEILPTASVRTDMSGTIISANQAAARLLNVSGRALPGRELLVFTENRGMFTQLIAHAQGAADPIAVDLPIRPRERRPQTMTAAVARLEPDATEVLWFLTSPSSTEARR